MFPFSRRKRHKRPTPVWMIILVIGFLIYSYVNNPSHKTAPPAQNVTPPVEADNKGTIESLKSMVDPEKILNMEGIKGRLVPKMSMNLTVKDNEPGNGKVAVCGQKAIIKYSAFTNDEQIGQEQETSFRIGSGEAMPALEKGVMGMKINGTRTIYSPGELAYGAEKFTRDDVPALAKIRFEVKMLDATPALPEIGAYRVLGDGMGQKNIYECGDTAKLNVTIWDLNGKKIYDSADDNGPVTFVIGRSQVFMGLEQGVLGMSHDMRRNLIVPPDFQKTLLGNKPSIDFPLPKDQIILVDVQSVP
jgi:FKBP-type peptidyl-prolyl cis-trans isomerase